LTGAVARPHEFPFSLPEQDIAGHKWTLWSPPDAIAEHNFAIALSGIETLGHDTPHAFVGSV